MLLFATVCSNLLIISIVCFQLLFVAYALAQNDPLNGPQRPQNDPQNGPKIVLKSTPNGLLRGPEAPRSPKILFVFSLVRFWSKFGLHLGPQGTPRGTQKIVPTCSFQQNCSPRDHFFEWFIPSHVFYHVFNRFFNDFWRSGPLEYIAIYDVL